MAKKRKTRALDPVAVLAEAARRVEAGDLDAALAGCERVLARLPDRTDALELRIVVALRQEDWASAHEHATRALAQGPTAKRHIAKARAAVGLGELDEAQEALLAALRLDPSDPTIYETEAAMHRARGALDDALTAAEGALALAPSRVEAHGAHAAILDALGRADEAIEAYRAGARARDGDGYGRRALLRAFAELLDRQGEGEEAAQVRSLLTALG